MDEAAWAKALYMNKNVAKGNTDVGRPRGLRRDQSP